jgi:ABC-type phosphate/phosphonate transport system substrate-binding protein
MINAIKDTIRYFFIISVLFAVLFPGSIRAQEIRITITQDQKNAAQKYKPLLDYLAKKGIILSYVEVKDYPSAAHLFAKGSVDAMFCGSGIAGAFMISELASPLVRPVTIDGYSTYWAVIIAPKGAPAFAGSAEYFKGKRVAFTSMASSGEFYFQSLPNSADMGATRLKADSHGDAIEAVAQGRADMAIVKNRVWDGVKQKYPGLAMVGEDRGENPDGTLIVSKSMPLSLKAKLSGDLLAIHNDPSPEASAVKNGLKILGFIKTSEQDFEHTLALLRRAGVGKHYLFGQQAQAVAARQ